MYCCTGYQWMEQRIIVFSRLILHVLSKAVPYGKLKGAQCSETVTSRVPNM